MNQAYLMYLFGGVALLGAVLITVAKNARLAAAALSAVLLAVGAIGYVLAAPLAGSAMMLLGAGATAAALLVAASAGFTAPRRGFAILPVLGVLVLGAWLYPVTQLLWAQMPRRGGAPSASQNLLEISPFLFALYLLPLEMLGATLVVAILTVATAPGAEDAEEAE